MPKLPEIPTFAIVGRSNEGKTTLMATLVENDQLEISDIPGRTRLATPYPLHVDDKVIHFWDTPGFQNTAPTYEWFSSVNRDTENPAAVFIREFQSHSDFVNECEIFKPLSMGAAVIYLADVSHPVREIDRQQLEILRRCGNPRIGVIYSKSGKGKHEDEWKKLFDQDLNTRREFNSHFATFADRVELLKAVGNVIPDWGRLMAECIDGLESQWRGKKRRTADAMLDLVAATLETEVLQPIGEDNDREAAGKKSEEKLRKKVRKLESACQIEIRKIFNHTLDHWDVDQALGGDLFSEEVWRILGMTKGQLVVAGAIAGAVAGGVIDAFTGGASFLIGTLIGASSGALIGWMSAEKFANFEFPGFEIPVFPRLNFGPIKTAPLRISVGGGKLGGGHARATVSPQSKLISILLDRGFRYARLVSQWSHGKVAVEKLNISLDDESSSVVQQWPKMGVEIKALGTLNGQLGRKPEKRNSKVREEAERTMKEILVKELDKLIG